MMSNNFLRNRAWVLGILHLANRAGMLPLSKERFHSIVYLANCLAPIYDDRGIETRVIKHQHGPFYPDAQWDLERLVGDGLATVENTEYIPENDSWWLVADYRITNKGVDLFIKCSAFTGMKKSYSFLVELINAFASINRRSLDSAALEDVIYSTPGRQNWTALVFDITSINDSLETVEKFSELVGERISLSPQERLNLYLEYLEYQDILTNPSHEEKSFAS